jgi:hypothetical protein
MYKFAVWNMAKRNSQISEVITVRLTCWFAARLVRSFNNVYPWTPEGNKSRRVHLPTILRKSINWKKERNLSNINKRLK